VATKVILESRDALRLLVPGPVTLLSTMYRDQPNLMAASWTLALSFDPVLIGVAVHPDRLSHEFVTKTEQFVLNVPTADLITAVHVAGTMTGREVDKFAACGLTPAEAIEVAAPVVAECVAHIECGLLDRQTIGDHDLFVGRVLRVQALDEAFRGVWNVAEEAGQTLHHLGADRYAGLANPYVARAAEDER